MTKAEVYRILENHYRKNYRLLVKRLANTVGSYYNSEDVVQEAYTRACRYWQAYEPDKDFGGWLEGILSNCIKDKMNDEQRHGAADDVPDTILSLSSNPINNMLLEHVRDLVLSKKENVSRILRLFFFQQLSAKEVSQLVPENAVNIWKIVSRFRQELKDMFGEKVFSNE